MLNYIRKHSNSVIVKIMLGLIVLTFFLFGMTDVIKKVTGRDYVLKVGDIKIGPNLLRFEYHKRSARIKEAGITDESIALKIVINQLIDEYTIDQMADDLGLIVSDKSVKSYIYNVPAFRTEDGKLNKAAVRNFMANAKLPESDFIDYISRNIKRMLISAPLSTVSTNLLANEYIKSKFEHRDIKMVEININDFFIENNFSDEELLKVYQENSEKFMIPEKRNFVVLSFDESNIRKNVSVSEEEIKKEIELQGEDANLKEVYDRIKSEMMEAAMEESLKEVFRNVEDDISAGLNCEEIAKKYNLSISKFEKIRKEHRIAEINNATPYIKEAIETAFALEAHQGSAFSESLDKTSHKKIHWLVYTQDILPEHVKAFEKLRKEVTEILIHNKKRELATNLAKSFVTSINDGVAIDYIASNNKKKVIEINDITQQTKLDEKPLKGTNINQDAFNKIFATANRHACFAENNNKILVMQIVGLHEEKNPVKEQVRRYKENLDREILDDLFYLMQSHYMNKLGVVVREEMLTNKSNQHLDF